ANCDSSASDSADTGPAPYSAHPSHTAPPWPDENSSGDVIPHTAHAVSDGWKPLSDSSFSRYDSATAAGSTGISSSDRNPESSSMNNRTLRSCSSATL